MRTIFGVAAMSWVLVGCNGLVGNDSVTLFDGSPDGTHDGPIAVADSSTRVDAKKDAVADGRRDVTNDAARVDAGIDSGRDATVTDAPLDGPMPKSDAATDASEDVGHDAEGPSCTDGGTLCDGACANLETDVANCGGCGKACPTGESCQSGTCACTPGTQQCADGAHVETCNASGEWGDVWECATGACSGGSCSGFVTTKPPSCTGGGLGAGDNCGGTDGGTNCCESLEVPGGTFYRDGVVNYPATISGFRLDEFDVTVGRFRSFINAGSSAWSPAKGTGIHTHLNGGSGLVNSGTTTPPQEYETGWQSSWTTNLATTAAQWTTNLDCDSTDQTWEPSTGNDTLPINCLTWYEAYAFCIWDGGFLPSEAEYDYAFMGGSDEYTYPWGDTAPGADASLAVYGCYYPSGAGGTCTGLQNIAPVGTVPAGNGVWGQSDLAGEMYGWLLDWYESPYSTQTCNDCADTTDTNASLRVIRGGSFDRSASYLLPTDRGDDNDTPTHRSTIIGLRCARAP